MPNSQSMNQGPYLALPEAGKGRNINRFKCKQILCVQGTPADSLLYIQNGRVKITVVSDSGKEATITVLSEGDFIGEEALAGGHVLRVATATALTPCAVVSLDRDTVVRLVHQDKAFSHQFLSFLLKRSMRTQADLVDHLFNSSEKRLARVLLLMAEAAENSEPETLLPEITQEALAGMVGTTRSRVSFFMNRFREHGLIQYDHDSRIRVYKSPLSEVLREQTHSARQQAPQKSPGAISDGTTTRPLQQQTKRRLTLAPTSTAPKLQKSNFPSRSLTRPTQ